jgi:hypothetical protein
MPVPVPVLERPLNDSLVGRPCLRGQLPAARAGSARAWNLGL